MRRAAELLAGVIGLWAIAGGQPAAAQTGMMQHVDLSSPKMSEAELSRAKADLASLGDAAQLEAALRQARAMHAEAEGKSQAAQAALATIAKAVEDARAAEARLTPPLLAAERRVGELESELKGLDRLLRKAEGASEALEEFRWLIEELRVSLFAQELKTPFPVSVKRLEKIWAELP